MTAYMDLYFAIVIFIVGLALFGAGLVLAFIQKRYGVAWMPEFIAAVLCFWLADLFNASMVQENINGTLTVIQPPSFGTILWLLGALSILLTLVFLFMMLFESAKLRGTNKLLSWKEPEKDELYDQVVKDFETESGYKLR